MRRTTRGFTLIELLTVIAIIGVLATIVMVSLSLARQKTRDARRVSDIKNIQLALEEFYNANLYYPRNIYTDAGFKAYLPAIPYDPSTGTACTTGAQASCYQYSALNAIGSGTSCPSGHASRYHLGAVLEADTAIAQDADAAVSTSDTCSGSQDADFDGQAASCVGTAAATDGTDNCYDVIN